jgi:acylphosphatase
VTKAVEVSVRGLVQGVSFRFYTQREAARLGVSGWVRNEVDGSVTVHAEGEDARVDALVAWCRTGPRHASVQAVEVRTVGQIGAASFEVRG